MEADFRNTILAQVSTFASSNSLEVVYPNTDPAGIPSSDDGEEKYLEVMVFPTTPEGLTTCGTGASHTWILQVVVWQRATKGELRGARVIDDLVSHFPVNSEFTGASAKYKRVTPYEPIAPINRDGWYATPVQFRFNTIN